MKQSFSDIHVLVVDDHSVVRALLLKAFTDQGYQHISCAEDGESALKILEEHKRGQTKVGLILADWVMPNMDGLQLFKKCQEVKEFSSIPFILLSAEATKKNIVHALSLGINDYLIKPIEPQKIMEKVESVLGKAQKLSKAA